MSLTELILVHIFGYYKKVSHKNKRKSLFLGGFFSDFISICTLLRFAHFMTCPQDYSYHLPDELIAQTPASERDLSKLLLSDGSIHLFREISSFLFPSDVLFFNNTRVIKARAVFPSLTHIRSGVEKLRETNIEIFFVEYR